MPVKEHARAVEKRAPARRPFLAPALAPALVSQARAPARVSQAAGPSQARGTHRPAAMPLHIAPVAGQVPDAQPAAARAAGMLAEATLVPKLGGPRGAGLASARPGVQGNARVARRIRGTEAGRAAVLAPAATPVPGQAVAPGPGAAQTPAVAPAAAPAPAPAGAQPAPTGPAPAAAGTTAAAVAPGAPARASLATVPRAQAPTSQSQAPLAPGAPAAARQHGRPGSAPGQARASAAGGPAAEGGVAPARAVRAAGAGHRLARDDPGFRATVARVDQVAAQQRHHGPAHGAATAAQAAAPGPAREVQATADAQQVARIDDQHPKEFDKAGFAALLRSRVDAKAPKNPQEARDFPSSGKLGELKTQLAADGRASAADAGADVRGQAQATPDQSGITPKPVTPLPEAPAAPAPGDLGAAQAAPKPLPAAEVSAGVNAQQQHLDDTYTQAKVTDEQLARANEPAFSKALADKQAVGQSAASMPAQYRATESTVIAGAQAQAVAAADQRTAAMHGDRAALLGMVTGQQHGTMAADQASRAKVTADLEQIYAKARKAVEDRLDKLDKDVGAAFDAALADARQTFESYVKDALDERYSDPLTWIDDKLLTWGLPAAVQAIYDAGRARFIEAMDVAIDHVSGLVADGLNEAKQLSADGRKQVSEAVDGLPAALRAVGREAAQGIGAKFDELDKTVTAKRDQLVDALAAKYQDGLKQLDDRITELQKENEGFLSKAYDAAAGVISTILEMKDLLLKVLAKAIDTINVIVADPIRFLGNLATAVGQGVKNFAANILTHLKKGFFEWLFAEVASAGITLPKTWDLKGIFDLVMQILGLTWPAVRKIAVEVVGEPIVRTLEIAAEPIIAFVREGPAGIWNWIKEQLSNLKEMVVDQIQGWVITNVIKAGITWLIGLLNPASAFIKACKAIYDVLEFIWTRGKQILEFVNAVVDSIAEIAAGSLGKAAQKVEDALARAIPVTIGFLAGLLGLGDLGETIKAVIAKIQKPVHDAVKWIITKAVALVKAAGRLLGIGKKEEEKAPHSDDPEKNAKITAALAELDERDAKADSGAGVEREQAEAIAAATRANHPVLTSIKVTETPKRFDYIWTSSPAAEHEGPKKKGQGEIPLLPYGKGYGHHIPAKSAFRDTPGYNENAAPAIPDAELKSRKINHGIISGSQHRGYHAFTGTVAELTWGTMEVIETRALVDGGAEPQEAPSAVQRAIADLSQQVEGPSRVPWRKDNPETS